MSAKPLVLSFLASFLSLTVWAQPPLGDRPERLESRPLTREELQRKQADELVREARTLYGIGRLRQRGDQLLEALKLLEKAAKLDPDAAEPRRALIPLYLGLAREEDAMDACRHVLERYPTDCDTAFEYARLLKADARFREAADVLGRGLESKQIATRPELLYLMLLQRAELLEKIEDYAQAAVTLKRLAQHLVREQVQLVNHGLMTLEEYPVVLARTYEREGVCYVHRTEYDEAIQTFQKARDFLQQQSSAETRLRAVRFNWQLSEVEYAKGSFGDALQSLDAYLQHYPIHVEAFERKVTLLRKLNRSTEIVPNLRKYARAMPNALSVQLLLARELSQERLLRPEADQIYQDLAQRFGTEEVYRGWFKLLQMDSRMNKIIDLLDTTYAIVYGKDDVDIELRENARNRGRAIMTVLRTDATLVNALLPVSLEEVGKNRKREIRTWQLLALLASRTRQLDKAEIFFRQCLVNVPRELEYDVYTGLMMVLHQAHKSEAVIKLCREAMFRKVEGIKQFYFHYQSAIAFSELGKDDEAIREAQNAVELAPDKKIPQRRMFVRLLAQAEKYDLALAECQSMFKEFTSAEDIRQARYALASVYQMRGEHAKAEEEFRRILEEDPNDPEANNNLGYHLAERNQKLDEAERMIRRAIEVDSIHRKQQADDELENSAYLDSLAWVLFRKGKHEQARELLERAVRLEYGTDSAVLWDHLGDVYAQLKQSAKAKQSWQNALKYFEYDRRSKKEGRPEATQKKIQQIGD